MLRLRVLNLAGALVFVTYAALTRAWPVLAVNLFVACIDLYYIVSLRSKGYFQADGGGHVRPADRELPLLLRAGHRPVLPGLRPRQAELPRCVFILRNLLPVGLFVYTEEAPEIRVHLDFVAGITET